MTEKRIAGRFMPGPADPGEVSAAGRAVRQRRYDIDWLRVLAMLAVFLFHSARFFDGIDWHIKDAERSEAAFVFVGFLSLWIMPLLMLIAGAGSWFALESKAAQRYVLERAGRLLVPLFTIGLFVLIPPQFYWDQVTKGRFSGSFLDFYPSFFRTIELRPGFQFLDFWSGHLWFLRRLFMYSLLGSPLLLFLKSEAGRRLIGRLALWCDRPGGILLFALPIAAVQVGLQPVWPGDHGGADFFYLLELFMIGYLLVADARFTGAIARHLGLCLVLAVAGTLTLIYLVIGRGYRGWETPEYSLNYAAFQALASLTTWCWLVSFLGLASEHLNAGSRVLSYANEAVLPFYVLHQTVILAVGWHVVRWDASIAIKYVSIAAASFFLIMAPYELIIRRSNALRAAFGMRLKPKMP